MGYWDEPQEVRDLFESEYGPNAQAHWEQEDAANQAAAQESSGSGDGGGWDSQPQEVRDLFEATYPGQGESIWEQQDAAHRQAASQEPSDSGWDAQPQEVRDLFEATYPGQGQTIWQEQDAANRAAAQQDAGGGGGGSEGYSLDVASELAARRYSEQFGVDIDQARTEIQSPEAAAYKASALGMAQAGELDYLLYGGWVEGGAADPASGGGGGSGSTGATGTAAKTGTSTTSTKTSATQTGGGGVIYVDRLSYQPIPVPQYPTGGGSLTGSLPGTSILPKTSTPGLNLSVGGGSASTPGTAGKSTTGGVAASASKAVDGLANWARQNPLLAIGGLFLGAKVLGGSGGRRR